MKNYKMLIIAFIGMLSNTTAIAKIESCSYAHLSKMYDSKIVCDKALDEDHNEYIKSVQVFVIWKSDGKKVIETVPSSYGDDAFSGFDCTSRSYITGFNKNAPIDYGDIIVADFNFDGKKILR